MRNAGGTLMLSPEVFTPCGLSEGNVTERYDTFNCSHCGTTCVLRAGVDPTHDGSILAPQPHWQSDGMGVCLMCKDGWSRGLICPACHKQQNAHGGCFPFQKRLELSERRQRCISSILAG